MPKGCVGNYAYSVQPLVPQQFLSPLVRWCIILRFELNNLFLLKTIFSDTVLQKKNPAHVSTSFEKS